MTEACLIVGVDGDDLLWTLVTPELFKTICEEINSNWDRRKWGDHPRLWDYEGESETEREGVIGMFCTQAWTTGDTKFKELDNVVIREVLTCC